MSIEYTVKRSSRRRKLTITVERDCSVVVHAPASTSDEAISKAVQSKRKWIHDKINHTQKYQKLAHPPGKELVSGESVLYLGRSYQVEVVDDDTNEVRFDQRFYIPTSIVADRRTVLQTWYVERAEDTILKRVDVFANALGVEYRKKIVVDNRYRWGSCTPNDNLHFNWRLIKAPMFVIDYVVVHELAHLIESNHTPRFWNIVRAQSPKMEKARQWLKENGQILEEDI